MRDYDVLIVGGGPSGSACAWQLTRAGLKVAIVDKKKFPRNKVCAGWITPAVLDELAIDPREYTRQGRILQPISGFRTGVIGRQPRLTRYGDIVSYGIRRVEFDDYLLRRSGADLLLGQAVSSMERAGGKWIVNGTLSAPLLIGAGGHFCPVARKLGAHPGRNEVPITAQEAEFPLAGKQLAECHVEEDTPELYFCTDLKGYGWAFRKGNYLNVGLGREVSHELSRHVQAFSDFLVGQGRISRDMGERFQGHAYLLYRQRQPRRLVDDGVMLIGDAAGLAYPQSGEGIRPAIESGLLAAKTVLRCTPRADAQTLEHYVKALERRFGADRQSSANTETAALRRWAGRQLLATGWFTRRIVLDQWFLHRSEPPLVIDEEPDFQAVG